VSRSWRPIPIRQLRVDADAPASSRDLVLATRTWLEVWDHDHLIGVVDMPATGSAVTERQIEDLREQFGSFGTEDRTVRDDELPSVSIVVPTICRDPERLERTVESFNALDYPSFEIIIVDNRAPGSLPALPAFEGMAQVRRAAEPIPGISAARNRGIALATGEIVAFTDDDAVVDSTWLRALASRFVLNPEVEGVGGLIMPLEFATEPQLWFEEFYGGFSRSFRPQTFNLQKPEDAGPLFPYAPAQFGAGGNMALRRDTLNLAGGFDICLGTGTVARGGEDLAMFLGLLIGGSTIAYEPGAIVRHMHRPTEAAFRGQIVGYGTGLTAMYTSLVRRDPRHLVAMLRRLPTALRHLLRPRADRSPSRTPSYPRYCLALQVYGMALGPIAYVRSLAHDRQRRQALRANAN